MFLEKENEIRTQYNNTVATATSVHSPQGVLLSRVAKEFGFRSIVGIGNTTVESAIQLHKPIKMSHELGSEIVLLCKNQAFNSVLYSRLNKMNSINNPMFILMFGINFKQCRSSIIDVISYQVNNIPEDIDTLVVSLGSGISFAAIVAGIVKYGREFRRVVAIQPFGYDRSKMIKEILCNIPQFLYKFEYHKGSYVYSKKLEMDVGFELDNIYESKAYDMMVREKIVDIAKEKVCFWVVGNNNITR